MNPVTKTINYIKKTFLLPMQKHWFLFQELAKRDFKKKYKRTVLGMGWSILSPLLQLLVLKLVFTQLFGRDAPHFTIYLFAGVLVFNYFADSTKGGMNSLVSNASIFSKVNVPKYLFLLSRNVSAFINFLLTLVLFFVFCILDHIPFTWSFFSLLYPIFWLVVFNIGVGMILSALFVFFRDMSYLYDVFIMLLRYLSAIFYQVDRFPEETQRIFLLNPVYCFIKYFRFVAIEGHLPSAQYHALCAAYAIVVVIIGAVMYKKLNTKYIYYI